MAAPAGGVHESARFRGEHRVMMPGLPNCIFPSMAESVALTPEEQRQFRPLFTQHDVDGTNIVLGERVRPLLERSGLPPIILSQIWQTVDTENRGFLDFSDFARCMRLVYHVQHGQQLNARLANIPSGLPDLSSTAGGALSPPPAPSPRVSSPRVSSPGAHASAPLTALSTGGSTYSANGETRIPAMTTQDKKRFGALFDRSVTAPDGFMDGNVAKEIFLKARLAPETLGQVWSLVDVDGRGKLTKNEFVVAMHLIQSLIQKTMSSLPSALPATWAPWLGSHGAAPAAASAAAPVAAPAPTGQGLASPAVPGHTGPAREAGPRAASTGAGAGAGAGSPPPVPPTSKMASLGIAPLERSQYDAIFDSLDQSRTGILGPAEAVPVLTKSGLPDEVLARVWDLADRQKRGQLDKSDFAMAMHLLKAKMNGKELPSTLPPAGAASPPPQNRAASPSGGAAYDAQAMAQPQRRVTTGGLAQQNSGSFVPKPPQRSLTQQSTSSSLDDLVSLDNAIFRPLEPAKTSRAEPIPEEANEAANDVKFVPTTSFGQQLLQNRARAGSAQAQGSAASPAQAQGSAASSAQAQGSATADAQYAQPAAKAQEDSSRGVASPPQYQQQPQPSQPAAAASPQVPDLQQQARELHDLESRIAAQHRERTAAHEELAAVLKEKSELETKVRDLRQTYDNGAKEVHQTKQAITEAREAIKQLEKDIALRSSGLEAIRSQQEEQNTARSAAQARHTELQEQLAQIQAQIDAHNAESQRFTEEQSQHKSVIAEHESKLEQLKSEADQSAWRRQELEAEALRHKERAVQAQAAAHAQAQRAEAEAAAAAEAAERAKAEKEAADAHSRALAASRTSPVAVTPAAAPTQRELGGQQVAPSYPTSATSSTVTEPRAASPRANSLNSASESVTGPTQAAETPRTSPPTSEANYPSLGQVTMPTFTLPMQQPHSATSSVVNNPPQSVRGDFGSEPSEPQSPDLSTPVSGINPPESMDLRQSGRIEDNDSFEFVDAREGGSGSGVDRVADESSDDDAGPADAIPQRYGQPSPRQPQAERELPVELRPQGSGAAAAATSAPSAPKATEGPSGVAAAPQPAHVAQPAQHAQPVQAAEAAPAGQRSPFDASAHGAPFASQPVVTAESVHSQTHPSVAAPGRSLMQEPTASGPTDDFDGFDDLEEARDDDTDDFGATFSSSQANTSSAGPDEWQQLFASSQPQQHQTAAAPSQPASQAPSGPIGELTSMGFTEEEARGALELHGNNLSEATNYLLDRM